MTDIEKDKLILDLFECVDALINCEDYNRLGMYHNH